MNKWSKVGLSIGMGVSVVAATHFINKLIFSSSTSKCLLNKKLRHSYHWKFGDISYYMKGDGQPVLLIHDLNSYSNSYEWNKIVDVLARTNQVFVIDLLGCGCSDKPNITYTTYLYTQLISDFIENVIKKRTSIIVTGNSTPMCIMTAYSNPETISKMILINPQNIEDAMRIPTKRSNFLRKIYNMPVFGTLIYNINISRKELKKNLISKCFCNPSVIPTQFLEVYHESAHLQGANAKYLYSSTQCHYTTASIAHALSNLDQSIYVIYGNKEHNIITTVNQYQAINPAIEKAIIYNTKHLPHVERPHEALKYISLFLND